jgi:iron transport multicopper oxidase
LGRYAGGPASDLAVITVESGKRYRFRLIAMACHPYWTFSIDSHTFTVIEADGVATEPLVVDSLDIYAAQRYSIVVRNDSSNVIYAPSLIIFSDDCKPNR